MDDGASEASALGAVCSVCHVSFPSRGARDHHVSAEHKTRVVIYGRVYEKSEDSL